MRQLLGAFPLRWIFFIQYPAAVQRYVTNDDHSAS
jgi:hypothetical protein